MKKSIMPSKLARANGTMSRRAITLRTCADIINVIKRMMSPARLNEPVTRMGTTGATRTVIILDMVWSFTQTECVLALFSNGRRFECPAGVRLQARLPSRVP
jgi:hypothetical protein